MVGAFPEDTAPRYLLRDRDKNYGYDFRQRIRGMRIEEVLSAPASPWQRPLVERLTGSVRRDCLDHVIVLGEGHLRRILKSYLEYYHRSRTHLAKMLFFESPARPYHEVATRVGVATGSIGFIRGHCLGRRKKRLGEAGFA